MLVVAFAGADSCGAATVRYADETTVRVLRSVSGHLDLAAWAKPLEASGQVPSWVPLKVVEPEVFDLRLVPAGLARCNYYGLK